MSFMGVEVGKVYLFNMVSGKTHRLEVVKIAPQDNRTLITGHENYSISMRPLAKINIFWDAISDYQEVKKVNYGEFV